MTLDCLLDYDYNWRLVITFQPIGAKQSLIEISHSHVDYIPKHPFREKYYSKYIVYVTYITISNKIFLGEDVTLENVLFYNRQLQSNRQSLCDLAFIHTANVITWLRVRSRRRYQRYHSIFVLYLMNDKDKMIAIALIVSFWTHSMLEQKKMWNVCFYQRRLTFSV